MLDKSKQLHLAKQAIGAANWLKFEEWLDMELEVVRTALERHEEPLEIYRAQGQIAALKNLRALRGKINAK